MKKTISLLLAVLLACASAPLAFAADTETNYLLLGDSITAGYGVSNRREASYGRIVADTNGYNYTNLARTATDSFELLDQLKNGVYYDEALMTTRSVAECVAEADIISLSIGANDYFDAPNTVSLLVKALFGLNRRELDAIADTLYGNFCEIIDFIRAENPDAVILAQTLYCVWYGFASSANGAASKRINAMLEKYDAEHPGVIHICDIRPAMEHKPENLADDCVHPNAAGNVAIARIVLADLYELGLGAETEPVVNVPGEDWNFWELSFDDEKTAVFVGALVKIVTGNGANVFRGRK
ncbi:MAG: SGNH/GDSL hydrolase family protein [Clostridia bacterium]|nr:SGNH/GDSL hydrolase family protein [Clostridia bacterium]